MNSKKLSNIIAFAASEKKASLIKIVDVRNLTSVTDYHIICDANNIKQTQAISDFIEEKTFEQGIKPLRIEGYKKGCWILLDYGSCVVHIFHKDDRNFYKLEAILNEELVSMYK